MASKPNVYSGGRSIGFSSDGTRSSPAKKGVSGFRGGKTIKAAINRGAKAAKPSDPSNTGSPSPFGGGSKIGGIFSKSKRVKGGGANTGGGTTSTTTDP